MVCFDVYHYHKFENLLRNNFCLHILSKLECFIIENIIARDTQNITSLLLTFSTVKHQNALPLYQRTLVKLCLNYFVSMPVPHTEIYHAVIIYGNF